MHASLYVAVHKSEVVNGKAAESFVEEMLSTNGFIEGQDGEDCGYADWFEIGGRWSSDLLFWDLTMKYGKDKAELWHKYAHGNFPVTKTRDTGKMCYEVFGKKRPKVTRDQYKYTHHILASHELIKYMIKEGMLSNGGDYHNGGYLYETCTTDKLLEAPDKSYWLVVVDFHS